MRTITTEELKEILENPPATITNILCSLPECNPCRFVKDYVVLEKLNVNLLIYMINNNDDKPELINKIRSAPTLVMTEKNTKPRVINGANTIVANLIAQHHA